MADRYFIKDGYRARDRASTVEVTPGEYWNRRRIRNAARLQRQVYLRARELLLSRDKGNRLVADVGCGYPIKTERLFRDVADRVVDFDQATLGATIARHFPLLEFRPVDLAAPQFVGQKFDLVIFSDVVEHLIDPDPALAFVRSLAGPDTDIVISTPERDARRGKDCMESVSPVHVREWNFPEFAAYLESRGLRVTQHSIVPRHSVSVRYLVSRLRKQMVGSDAPLLTCQMAICRLA